MTDPLQGIAAAVLAGGFGMRLRSVVEDRPKALAEARGRLDTGRRRRDRTPTDPEAGACSD